MVGKHLIHPGDLGISTWKTAPKGMLKATWGLPATTRPTKEFYDTSEVFGMNFPRKVQPSAWATKRGLAGRNIEKIRLHELS